MEFQMKLPANVQRVKKGFGVMARDILVQNISKTSMENVFHGWRLENNTDYLINVMDSIIDFQEVERLLK